MVEETILKNEVFVSKNGFTIEDQKPQFFTKPKVGDDPDPGIIKTVHIHIQLHYFCFAFYKQHF